MQVTKVGDRCLAPKSGGVHGGYNYKAIGLYEAQPRKDGVLTWRLVVTVCEVTTEKKLRKILVQQSEVRGIPVRSDARNNVVCP